MDVFDVAILGGGPAGISAGIYAARFKLNAVIITNSLGGTAQTAHLIENYPGYGVISGFELMQKFKDHLKSFEVPVIEKHVYSASKENDFFKIKLIDQEVKARYILIATGTKRRKLGVPGEAQFYGKGVSYCVTCDAFFYRDKTVAVVGGSDAANMAAILLASMAKKVYVIYRKEKLRGELVWIERVITNPKIEVLYNSNVIEIKGKDFVEGVKLEDGREISVDGVFVEIGSIPECCCANDLGIEINQKGYMQVDSSQKTNIDRVYAAGDVTSGSNGFQQIVTAASEGVIAIKSIFDDMEKSKVTLWKKE
ncbi:MAG: thioredoxin reductase [Candidatus Methanofastidiosum methylothiophilum]|uniref:Thioredoxin reductase n=1 Tax=Candidatus Methanofastidiosum methylothiophilum TaxID=1705564 RepID=A0A150IJL6_9EURY|nr:MAG: thioredoxin reductase [Candidatus Methanofastidiosum methylthiophilus]KYC47251.1 MAG: thioredoxin reductase [Candidatus Methanofastidiosum methylthiophilus]KYC50345.1 MAG: thioredoxin reductase [Candidatus Methanofastidiosum methylthiophilus]